MCLRDVTLCERKMRAKVNGNICLRTTIFQDGESIGGS